MKMLMVLLLMFAVAPCARAASMDEAQALIEQGRDAEAVAMLTKLAEQQPKDYRLWFMLGVAEAHRKHFQPAIRHFRRVLKLKPTLAEPHNNLAVIYNELGDLRAAVRELETSLELNPAYATAHENIGDLYVKLALESYQKAMIDNDSPELRLRYERLLHLRDAPAAGRAPAVPEANLDRRLASTQTPGGKPASGARQSGRDESEPGDGAEVAAQPQPEVHPLLTAADQAAVQQAIEAWRKAWSGRDIEAYFSAYAPGFQPPKRFASLASWKRYKRRVIGNKSFIEVKLDNMRLTAMADGRVLADFRQEYRADGYHSRDHKQLMLEKTAHGWKIVSESVL